MTLLSQTCRRLVLTLPLTLTFSAVAQLEPPPEPAGNPLTAAKANLGKALFWEEQLSSTRTVACGTCHTPEGGGDDPRSASSPLAIHPGADGVFGGDDDVFGSPGVPLSDAAGLYLGSKTFGLAEQATNRRSTSAINTGYATELFWDGRATDEFVDPVTKEVILATGGALESQAIDPPVSDVEMGHSGRTWPEVLDRIANSEPLVLASEVPAELATWIAGRSYAELFEEAFGSSEISAARFAMAVASYERTLFSDQTPFDEFILTSGGLTDQELDGRGVFVASRCDRCHELAILTDHDFHYTGVRPQLDDLGRGEVTGLEEDFGKMRTPSLRNLELRAPFMRNGRFATIEDVIDFYDRGGDFDAPNKDPLIIELGLTAQEKADLLAFLTRPLTDPRVGAGMPPFDRPSLFTEGDRVPRIEGSGIAGTDGIEPRMVALEPPMAGNPSFTVGLFDGLGGAQALLVIDSSDPGTAGSPPGGDFAFETITLEGGGGGQGFGSVSLSIPPGAIDGSTWFGRWYITDPGAAGGLAISPLLRFEVFAPLDPGNIFRDGFESQDLSLWSSHTP